MMFDEDNNNSNRVKKRSNHNRNSSRLAFETLREWYFGDRAISDADFLPRMAGLDSILMSPKRQSRVLIRFGMALLVGMEVG
jgi:hypothetical protein